MRINNPQPSIRLKTANLRIFCALFLCAASIMILGDRLTNGVYAQGANANFTGDYKRSFSGAEGAVKEKIRIKKDNTVKLRAKSAKGKVIHTGVWAAEGNRLVVTLNKKGDQPINPDRLIFELRDDALIAVEYDQNRYGAELKFSRAK